MIKAVGKGILERKLPNNDNCPEFKEQVLVEAPPPKKMKKIVTKDIKGGVETPKTQLKNALS